MYVSLIERDKILIYSFHLQISGILQTKMGQTGDPMKRNFDNFQIQKSMSETVRAQKVDEKNAVICLVSFFSSFFFFSFIFENCQY